MRLGTFSLGYEAIDRIGRALPCRLRRLPPVQLDLTSQVSLKKLDTRLYEVSAAHWPWSQAFYHHSCDLAEPPALTWSSGMVPIYR